MENSVRPRYESELLQLLLQQPPARLHQIALRWGSPSTEPTALYRWMIGDRSRMEHLLLSASWTGLVQQVLTDMVQDFGLPVTLYQEDRIARTALSESGLIYPCPAEWGVDDPRYPQWSWTMPVEVAILCARVVPIFRPRLPLLLGNLDDARVAELLELLQLKPHGSHPEDVIQIGLKLLEPGFLDDLLMAPEWYDHLFTLQIVLEWHGICHRQELFSFAWGDATLRPLTARDQQLREQTVERDLTAWGLLYPYSPTDPDPQYERPLGEKFGTVEEQEGAEVRLLLLPEELRPNIWTLSRQIQEGALRESLEGFGGWSPGVARVSDLDDEPADRIKGLVCVLESNGYPSWKPLLLGGEEAVLDGLNVELDPRGPRWGPLISLGLVTGVLVKQNVARRIELGVGRAAARLLDEGPAGWSRSVLEHWVRGQGPTPLDRAQNLAFGLSEEWLEEVAPLSATPLRRTPAMLAWWRHLHDPRTLDLEALDPSSPRTRRKQRPTPTWLQAGGAAAGADVWCGNPRMEADRPMLQRELYLLEGIYTTFRLLLLDLLSGLPSGRTFGVSDLGFLTQDLAALALHLNLAVLLFDISGQTFVPVRPPSFLVEPGADESFDELARALLEWLLVPAGVAEFTDSREEFRLLPDRIAVETPLWFDDAGRVEALSQITGLEAPHIRRALPARHIRRVAPGHVESDRRFWLGRPLDDLRRALAGRPVKALRAGYLETVPL